MRKIDIVGSISIVLGVLAIGAMSLVVMWPLWLGIAAVLAASRLGSFINDNKEVMAAKITQVITRLRPKPQPVIGSAQTSRNF